MQTENLLKSMLEEEYDKVWEENNNFRLVSNAGKVFMKSEADHSIHCRTL